MPDEYRKAWDQNMEDESNKPAWSEGVEGLDTTKLIPIPTDNLNWTDASQSPLEKLAFEAFAELKPEIEAAGKTDAPDTAEDGWSTTTTTTTTTTNTSEAQFPATPTTEAYTRDFVLDVLAELKPEIDAQHQAQESTKLVTWEKKPRLITPPLEKVLNEFGPMPPEALFLGVASDGLPVLLNLHDPVPGPILIAGDEGTGKTALLRNIARAAEMTHTKEQLQFAILTPHPEEWEDLENLPNSTGVFPTYHQSAEDLILELASWAHGNKDRKQSNILLIDDLESVMKMDFDAQQNLRWLLLRGPGRRVWPIISVNPNRMENIMPWLDAFHTRIFGPIENKNRARQLDAEAADLTSLDKGLQFTMREGDKWLTFWVPSET